MPTYPVGLESSSFEQTRFSCDPANLTVFCELLLTLLWSPLQLAEELQNRPLNSESRELLKLLSKPNVKVRTCCTCNGRLLRGCVRGLRASCVTCLYFQVNVHSNSVPQIISGKNNWASSRVWWSAQTVQDCNCKPESELTSLICFESQVSIDVVGTEQRPCGEFRLAYSSWLIDGGCFTTGGFQHFSSSFLSISHFLFLPTPISWCRSMLQSGVVFKYKIIAEHWRPDLSSLVFTTLWFYHCPSSRWEVSREGDS